MKPALSLLCTLVCSWAAEPTWTERIAKGTEAARTRDYATAETEFVAAAEAAAAARSDLGSLEAARLLASLARSRGNLQRAEEMLNIAITHAGRLHGSSSPELSPFLSELGLVRRSAGNLEGAAAALEQGVTNRLQSGQPDASSQARDLTALGLIYRDLKNDDRAMGRLLAAIHEWDRALRDDPEVLPALEGVAGLHRDAFRYAAAQPLYERALRIREIAYGPGSAEVISALDSLAYVLFGQKNYVSAEPLYQRLLAVWETSAGPNHPMVALTLDKMAEFYFAQERYAEAEPLLVRAIRMRAVQHVASLQSRARLLLADGKREQAGQTLQATLDVGKAAGLSDADLAETLRTYAKLLRDQKKLEQAAVIQRRWQAAATTPPERAR